MSLSHAFQVIDALMTVLDEDRANAVIEHRKALRKPLTKYAATLLAKQFALCADPNEAADEMILRGWQGFKPEWVKDRNMQQRKTNYVDAARNIFNGPEGLRGGGDHDERLPVRLGRH